MRLKLTTVLYMAAGACAIVALAVYLLSPGTGGTVALDPQKRAHLEELREGDMKKLVIHAEPRPVVKTAFTLESGGETTLADYSGKVLLVNFWATWCAPCRKEMPMLSDLQTELGGDAFEVLTIATGRNPPQAMKQFFDEIGVDNLPLHIDPKQKLARDMGVLGLPITVVIGRDGHELARMQGDAHWNSDSAKAILQALIDDGAEG